MALTDTGYCWALYDVKSSGENAAPTHNTFTSKHNKVLWLFHDMTFRNTLREIVDSMYTLSISVFMYTTGTK